uniref:Ovule protein n=1 Tax=Ditylenchus dipsaci TaxID=166011 RepID=A0A915DB01_9BILA
MSLNFEVPSYLYYFSCFINGIWLHLAAFSCGFCLLNIIIWMLRKLHWTKAFLDKYLLRLKFVKLLATDHQFQVLTTLFCTF